MLITKPVAHLGEPDEVGVSNEVFKLKRDSRVEPIKEEEEKAPEEERGSGDMAAATFLCKCSTLRGVRLSLLQHSSE
ncbi:hypothetical protein Tco_0844137, partial [Tanacetum coccineum]